MADLERRAAERDPPHHEDVAPVQVHMFWHGSGLSQLERMCIRSFLQNGFQLTLWSYGEVTGTPEGAIRGDAGEILPEDRVFTHMGALAAFADIFRCGVLSRMGGLWVDTDVICLIPEARFRSLLPGPFLVTERTKDAFKRHICNNVIYNPAPSRGDLVDLVFALSERIPPDRLHGWSPMGPKLFNVLAEHYPWLTPDILAPSFANSVDYWNSPQTLLAPGGTLDPEAAFLHCYHQVWVEYGYDKHVPFPEGSLLAVLDRRFGGVPS